MNDNCLGCRKYAKCSKKRKGPQYICDSFKPHRAQSFDSLFGSSSGPISVSDPKPKKKKKQVEIDLSTDIGEAKAASEIEKMMEQALSAQSRAPIDFRIDDRELKEFPNFWSYCTSPEGLKTKPFPRQLWMLTQLFSEWCPRCSRKGMNEIDAVAVDENLFDLVGDGLVLLENGVCPKCKRGKSKLIRTGKLNMYQELNACLGQRSGKSVSTSMGASYFTHKLLKMQRPTMVYNLLPDSLLTMTFVGLTFAKAVETLWTSFHSMLSTAPWFVEYHKLLDYYADKYNDDEIYKFGAQTIHYKHRNLFISPSGPSKRTLRGSTRVFAAIDELGWFPMGDDNDDRERQSANEVYIALDRSMKTIRGAANKLIRQGVDNVMTGVMVNISSPSHNRDKIMTLVRESEGSTEQLGLHLPTWKFNPDLPRSEFKKEYRQDAVKAERDFGAVPPINENALFSDTYKLLPLFGPHANKVRYQYVVKTNVANKKKMRHAKITNIHVAGSVAPSILSLDAGYSNNSFGMAVMHENRVGDRKFRVVDALVEIAPKLKKDVLNYTRIHKDVICEIIERMNVKVVITDRWQSKKILHDLMEQYPHLIVREYSLTYEDMLNVRDYLIDDVPTIQLPRLEVTPKQIAEMDVTLGYPHCFKYMPAAHLHYQFQTVQDSGNQIVKGPGLTDDVWRAMALGMSHLLDDDFVAECLQGEKTVRVGGVGMGVSRSGGISPMMHNAALVQQRVAGRSGAAIGTPQPSKLGAFVRRGG